MSQRRTVLTHFNTDEEVDEHLEPLKGHLKVLEEKKVRRRPRGGVFVTTRYAVTRKGKI